MVNELRTISIGVLVRWVRQQMALYKRSSAIYWCNPRTNAYTVLKLCRLQHSKLNTAKSCINIYKYSTAENYTCTGRVNRFFVSFFLTQA